MHELSSENFDCILNLNLYFCEFFYHTVFYLLRKTNNKTVFAYFLSHHNAWDTGPGFRRFLSRKKVSAPSFLLLKKPVAPLFFTEKRCVSHFFSWKKVRAPSFSPSKKGLAPLSENPARYPYKFWSFPNLASPNEYSCQIGLSILSKFFTKCNPR